MFVPAYGDPSRFITPVIALKADLVNGGIGFNVSSFPAVTEDGAQIALAIQSQDGGRGNPNLKIVILNADTDRPLLTQEILSPEQEAPAEAALRKRFISEIEKKIAELNRYLAIKNWRPMNKFITGESCSRCEERNCGACNIRIDPTGHTLAFREPVLIIKDAAGHSLHRGRYPAWSARRRTGEFECENPAHLDEVYSTEGISVLLLKIGYSGTDVCWEPDASFHAVLLQGRESW